MENLAIVGDAPNEQELIQLADRCKEALKRLRGTESEVRLPLIVEFSGSPKSGKTSIIGIVAHFFKRMGAEVIQPVEGASLRTPAGLRDDWLAFNAWSGCYALQQILSDCNLDSPPSLVILDRGLFDVVGWMKFLRKIDRLHDSDEAVINAFFTLELWRKRENAVFLFTADAQTSMRRESDSKLTTKEHGSVMTPAILKQIHEAYIQAAGEVHNHFDIIYHVDTSENPGSNLIFQRVAFEVAAKIVDLIERMSTQTLLVTKPVEFDGFVQDSEVRERTISQILNNGMPQFLDRETAERSTGVQQVVPYGLLQNGEGLYFCAQRKSSRPELRGKYTILVGGHAEQKDWEAVPDAQVFERCLRRELDEELIGLQVLSVKPLGFISDDSTKMGAHHLAFIHEVRVGGRTSLRRQSIDQEFGRGTLNWRTTAEIAQMVEDLDPWSQLVAEKLLGAIHPKQGFLFRRKPA